MRDNLWLEKTLDEIWANHFSDVKKINPVFIYFSKKAKRRLGTIRIQYNPKFRFHKKIRNDDNTLITINGHFKNENIPEYVAKLTIAHELVHYAHGFSSPYKQDLKYPHKGRVVEKELIDRGLGYMLELQETWMKKNWNNFLCLEAKNERKMYILRHSKRIQSSRSSVRK